MKTALLLASILMVSATSQSLTLKGTTQLNEWNLSGAGTALLKQVSVSAKVNVQATGALTFKFNGYSKIEVCDLRGESPNGEPEFAPCLKSHLTYAPQLVLELPVKLTTWVEGLKGSQSAVLTSDLTECVSNYDRLVKLDKPSAAPAKVTLKSKCDLYLASAQFTTKGKSAQLANADSQAIASILLETKLQPTHVITIEDGKVSAEGAADIAQAGKSLKSGGTMGNSVYLTSTIPGRDGKAIELFNYGINIEIQ